MAEKRRDPNFVPPNERPVVEVVKPSYQPSKADLEADLRVPATFKDAIKALVRPVKIRYIRRLK